MQHQPAECPLHRPSLALGYKPALLRVLGDHLHIDPVRRAGVDDALLVPGIRPCHRHLRVAVGHLLHTARPPTVSCTLAAVTSTTRSKPSTSAPPRRRSTASWP